MTNDPKPSEREEIEMLLPWYGMGTLDAADYQRVDAYLAKHPEMRAQLDIIETERVASVQVNEAITAPRSLTVERLLADAKPRTAAQLKSAASRTTASANAGFWSAISGFFTNPTPAAVRYAACAVAALIALQAVAIGTLVGLRRPT
ncbi:MAG: hypothetical protein AAFR23_01820, partial [Pseudomonadota bacterium]